MIKLLNTILDVKHNLRCSVFPFTRGGYVGMLDGYVGIGRICWDREDMLGYGGYARLCSSSFHQDKTIKHNLRWACISSRFRPGYSLVCVQ